MRRFALAILLPLALVTGADEVRAAWPHDPFNGNLPVCQASNNQYDAQVLADGAGGVFVVWHDLRGSSSDIYAQHLDATGAALWTASGVAVCTAASFQGSPELVSDNAGGIIVVWYDYRSVTNYDVYAQRLNAAGAPQWTANGVALCTATGDQHTPRVVGDGAGGAIVSWADGRIAAAYVIYAQKISAAGTTAWTANGVALCNAGGGESSPRMVTDGAGGAIVAWVDYRTGVSYDIYAQRISSAGLLQWTTAGRDICTASGTQTAISLAADGVGGAVVAWADFRNASHYDIYAQRVAAGSNLYWSSGGVAVCGATGAQGSPKCVADGSGGAFIVWDDERVAGDQNIYAQRMSGAGAGLWTADGVAVCSATSDQYIGAVAPDGAGGATMAWRDERAGNSDVYAQRISGTGAAQWAANGTVVSAAAFLQDSPCIASDGAGGAIVAWQDARTVTTLYDIYAQRIERYGQLGNPEPVITSVSDVRNDQGGFVKVAWSASYLDEDPVYGVSEYRVFRSVPGPFAKAWAARRGTTDDSDVAVREGRLLVLSGADKSTSWEYVGSQVAEAFPLYSRVVATTADSLGGSNPLTSFLVEARASTSVSSDRWSSAPVSGYSVDNLAPVQPAPFTGNYVAGGTRLHWNPNHEPDLAGYRLYRGSSAGFVPDSGNLVAAKPDTGYVDSGSSPYSWYKLRAVDTHGNESPVAVLAPQQVTAAPGGVPGLSRLVGAVPNPFNPATAVVYELGRRGNVTLAIYDAAGRLVRTLVHDVQDAGRHEARWDGTDQDGRGVAAGVYLCRLEADDVRATKRLTLVR